MRLRQFQFPFSYFPRRHLILFQFVYQSNPVDCNSEDIKYNFKLHLSSEKENTMRTDKGEGERMKGRDGGEASILKTTSTSM